MHWCTINITCHNYFIISSHQCRSWVSFKQLPNISKHQYFMSLFAHFPPRTKFPARNSNGKAILFLFICHFLLLFDWCSELYCMRVRLFRSPSYFRGWSLPLPYQYLINTNWFCHKMHVPFPLVVDGCCLTGLTEL